MRKLVLFAVLGGVFGLALLLEHFVTRPAPRRTDDADHLVAVFGGYPPREIPAAPPEESGAAPAGAPQQERGDANGRARGAKGAGGGGDRPVEPPPAAAKEHVVARGETLASIARAQLGSANRWHDLAQWNGIPDPSVLPTGARLRLTPPNEAPPAEKNSSPPKAAAKEKAPAPGERTHRVVKGDTLSHLAAQYLGDASRWREIQRLNNIPDPPILTEGRTLQLPQR